MAAVRGRERERERERKRERERERGKGWGCEKEDELQGGSVAEREERRVCVWLVFRYSIHTIGRERKGKGL